MAEGTRKAIADTHAKGLPVTVLDRETGRIVRWYPDGRKVPIDEPSPADLAGVLGSEVDQNQAPGSIYDQREKIVTERLEELGYKTDKNRG